MYNKPMNRYADKMPIPKPTKDIQRIIDLQNATDELYHQYLKVHTAPLLKELWTYIK